MENIIIGVIGPKGSGKTHAVAEYIGTLPRVAVFDMLGEFLYAAKATDIVSGNPREFFDKITLQNDFRVIYKPSRIETDGDDLAVPAFDTFVRACFLAENLTMVIDEAHLLCTARKIPPALAISNLVGRHRSLSIVYVAQSFASISRPLTRNTDEFWFHKNIEPSDLKGIADRCGFDVADRVQNLRRREVVNGIIVPGEMLRWTVWEGIANEGIADEKASDNRDSADNQREARTSDGARVPESVEGK